MCRAEEARVAPSFSFTRDVLASQQLPEWLDELTLMWIRHGERAFSDRGLPLNGVRDVDVESVPLRRLKW